MINRYKKRSLRVSSLTDTQACVFFRRNAYCFGEGFKEIAVVCETTAFKCFHDVTVLIQDGFGNTDAACGDVFVDGGAGGGFENPADIGFTQIELSGQLIYGNWLRDILIDIGQNIIHLMIVTIGGIPVFSGICTGIVSCTGLLCTAHEQGIKHDHQFHEGCILCDVMGKALCGSDFVNIVEKALLLFLV